METEIAARFSRKVRAPADNAVMTRVPGGDACRAGVWRMISATGVAPETGDRLSHRVQTEVVGTRTATLLGSREAVAAGFAVALSISVSQTYD